MKNLFVKLATVSRLFISGCQNGNIDINSKNKKIAQNQNEFVLKKAVKEKLDKLPKINVYKKLAKDYPKGFIQFVDYAATLYIEDGKVSSKEREIGIMRVARNTNSKYEAFNHHQIALQVGVTEEELNFIATKETVTELTPKENLICKVADELCANFKISDKTHKMLFSEFGTEPATEIIVGV